MTKVLIIKNWTTPNLLRQTPNRKGVWDDIHFTLEIEKKCDYVIVLNYSLKEVKVSCPRENIWCVLQEPPNEYFKYRHQANKIYYRVFTQDPSLEGKRYIHSQPALPWHVDKTYDDLINYSVPDKSFELSFITSSKTSFAGQRQRINFLDRLKSKLKFDLFGYGYTPINDKWDGLAPYRYSLVIENHKGPYYWSEKLADCFLSWTMPIYYGCTNITDYFPQESLIQIDINDPNVTNYIREAIKSDLWRKRRKAIATARDLVLNKYQFFPYFAKYIHDWEKQQKGKKIEKEEIVIPTEETLFHRLKLNVKKMIAPFV